MRRYAFLLGFLAILAAPFVVRGAFLEHRQRATEPEADGPELRILTPHNQDIRDAFARAFAAWHEKHHGSRPKIIYLTPGGTLDIVRYVTDSYTRRGFPKDPKLDEAQISPVAELVFGGGDTTFDRELKPFLKPVTLPKEALEAAFPTPDLNGVPLYEPTSQGAPRWIGVVLSSFGMVYSPEFYRVLNLPPPTTWQDLARPELAGLLALADPTRSGSAAVAYLVAVQSAMAHAEEDYWETRPGEPRLPSTEPGYLDALESGFQRGMSTLLLMAANARYFTDSAGQPPNDVGNGEAAAAVAIDFYARIFQEQVGPERLRYVAPRAATAIAPDPIGVLYGTRGERERLANRFIEFLLTPEAQRLWILKGGKSPFLERSLRRLPIRRDVYRDRRDFADDVDPFSEAGGFNLRTEWMGSFRELRLVWAAAFIDGKGALDAARRRIQRVEDPSRQRALFDELAALPFELAELTRITRERKNAKDSRLFLARTRVELGMRFRRHYQALAEKAAAP